MLRSFREGNHLFFGAAAGAAIGLLLFGLESAWALHQGAIGLKVDVSGPFAALIAAAKAELPSILSRVAIAYGIAGLCIGLFAAGLDSSFRIRHRGRRWLAYSLEFLALSALLVWDRAIARPALFDDLEMFRTPLSLLVAHGQPWHPRLALGVILAVHAIAALRTYRIPWLVPVAVGLSACVLWLGLPSRSVPTANRHPLVLLIGLDAFRPDRLGVYGGSGEVAPHLEEFVKDSVLFDRAYTPIAQTEPAWRAMLAGLWPQRTGVRYPLTAEWRWEATPTFPDLFSQSGYHTTFFTDCSRFNYQGPISGFEERHQPPRGAINLVLEKLRFRALGIFADNALGARWLPEFIDNRALAGVHDPIGYARRLAAVLVEQAQSGPLLFAYHATAAHFPGDPVYPFYRRFVDPREPLERRLRMTFSPIEAGAQSQGSRAASEALYDELLSQADAQLGIILGALKKRGLYDEALIVVFSDHGESFHADRPELEGATPVHGSRIGEEENRIVLAIKTQKSERVQPRIDRIHSVVRLIDIGPTLLEVEGLPPLPNADGVSLAPLLKGQSMPPLRLYAETGFSHASPAAFDPNHLSAAARSFDSYRVRSDGVVEVSDEAHRAILNEKDTGAFDGERWIIRAPQKDGSIFESCRGSCYRDGGLRAWLDEVLGTQTDG